ncbi:hypothetical protein Tco_1447784 [Tanacetum coccineum]
MRTASAAVKPCQGDSLELYLIIGNIYTDQRGIMVLLTIDFRYSDTVRSDTERLSRSDEVLKLKNFKKDATLKLFKSTIQEWYEHVGPEVTSSQDGKVNKMAKQDYAWLMISRCSRSHSRQAKEQAQDLKSMITTSNHKLMIEVKDYELKTKVEAYNLFDTTLLMMTLADKSLLSSGDNKPLMLEKHLYDSWKRRIVLYMMNRPHGRMILASVEKGPLVWPTIIVDGVTRPKEYTELTLAETIQADCDIKAINIILQGLLTEIYALVSQHRVAKDI